ncbi:MAG: SHOCT domain-containing protein [Acidimicrobiales bacterium]
MQDAASTGGTADELTKLAELRNSGVITDAEFADQKAKLLG